MVQTSKIPGALLTNRTAQFPLCRGKRTAPNTRVVSAKGHYRPPRETVKYVTDARMWACYRSS
jgi:hypothetical protein